MGSKVNDGVLHSGLTKRERHSGLGVRGLDSDVSGVHGLATLHNGRLVPDSDGILKKIRIGIEDLRVRVRVSA